MKAAAPCLFALVLLTGCATSQGWSVNSVDQPDGVVLISYETDDLESPPIGIDKATSVATRYCTTMGYHRTESLVDGERQCSGTNAAGACSLWQVDLEFQCAGDWVASPEMLETVPPSLRTVAGS